MSHFVSDKVQKTQILDSNYAVVAPLTGNTANLQLLANTVDVSASAVTDGVAVNGNYGTVYYTDDSPGVLDSVSVQGSMNDTLYFTLVQLSLTDDGTTRSSVSSVPMHGLNYMRVKNNSTLSDISNVYCQVNSTDF